MKMWVNDVCYDLAMCGFNYRERFLEWGRGFANLKHVIYLTPVWFAIIGAWKFPTPFSTILYTNAITYGIAYGMFNILVLALWDTYCNYKNPSIRYSDDDLKDVVAIIIIFGGIMAAAIGLGVSNMWAAASGVVWSDPNAPVYKPPKPIVQPFSYPTYTYPKRKPPRSIP